MNGEKLSRKNLEWCPSGRRRRRKGRPRNSWRQEVTTGMRMKGINSMGWIDKKIQKKNKVKILGIERFENMESVH